MLDGFLEGGSVRITMMMMTAMDDDDDHNDRDDGKDDDNNDDAGWPVGFRRLTTTSFCHHIID